MRTNSAPVQILSSPNKVPHTGRDGIPRTRTKDGSKYKLEDVEDMESDEVKRVLYEVIKIVREQSENPDPRFVKSAIWGSLRSAIQWVCSTDVWPTPDLKSLSAEDTINFLNRVLILFQAHHADTPLIQDAKVRLRSTIK